ncbi:MAG: VOC family protein, partial [Burkholderia sp.]|nr:VOC family protein [Burkholderia sp.]
MSSERIEAVYLTTHNWGKSAKFFQALGFKLEFETDHHSGQLRSGDGPFLFIAEVPPGETPAMQVVLKVADEQAVQPQSIVEVVTPFEDTHWGTR